jgi:ribosomal protein S18 acetylase RimI-like enzyme
VRLDDMGKLAFVFPGQGSQAVGMGKDLHDAFPEARAIFDEVDAALGERLSALCFEGHQAVACVRFYSDNGLYFHRLAVRPACQGRGIGKAMIAWLEREAIARGERSLACRVRASSPRNVALYKALGFVVEREEHFRVNHDHLLCVCVPRSDRENGT